MRGNYSMQRRRSGGGGIQWMIFGMVLGFACSAILVLGAVALGVLSLDPNAVAMVPTAEPIIITATPQPRTDTPTPEPTIQPTNTSSAPVQVEFPTAAPTTPPAPTQSQAAILPTTNLSIPTLGGGANNAGAQGAAPSNVTTAGTGASDRLQLLASELIAIPGGTFTMGTTAAEVITAVNECVAGYGGNPGACSAAMGEDSSPPHNVTLDSFFIDATEVSYEQYLAFLNGLGAGSHRNGCGGFPCVQTRTESETSTFTFDGAIYAVPPVVNNLPVTNVTWYGALAYCQALGRRLPTEAEWERAARGDTGFIFPWGNTWDATRATTNRPLDSTTPIGKVPVNSNITGASPYGVLNMAGNVAEWVSDWYDPRFYSRPEAQNPNTTGPTAGTNKVVRGGSWDAVPFFARTIHRQDRVPNDATAWIGFRCASDTDAVVPATGGGSNGNAGPIGVFTPTTDPAFAGSAGSEEESLANAQPTLRPLPTNTQSAPPTPLTPLAPGG